MDEKKGTPVWARLVPSRTVGWVGKRSAIVLLSAGSLSVLAVSLALSWISVRVLQPSPGLPSQGGLSWDRTFGEHGPSRVEPTEVPVQPAIGKFVLPHVLSVEDAVERKRGWVLLDRRLGKIHTLDTNTGSIQSIGGLGSGPGELQDPVALALTEQEMWVLNQRGLALDRYSLATGFLDRRRVQGGGCMVGLPKGFETVYAERLMLLRVCPSTLPGPGTAWIEAVHTEGTLSPILQLPLGTPGIRRIFFLRQPVLSASGDRVFLGTWDAPCIGEFDAQGRLIGHRCLPDYARPSTTSKSRSDLEKRLRRVTDLGFLHVGIPDHLPWYDQIFATPGGLAVRRVRGEEERDLVMLRSDGRIQVADGLFPENTFVGSWTVLVVRDVLRGTEIEIFPNPFH